MRVLLDECVDVRLARTIAEHDVWTVARLGWAGITDGVLLERAAKSFDVLITTDRNLEFQQNLARFDLAVVVLEARTNRLADLELLVPSLLALLPMVVPGRATHISA